ncbi:MAG: hypothetical protein ACOY0T_35110 [Myxococcota bacterium]
MSSEVVPTSIEEFLLERVETHEQLQALLWLQAHPDISVTAATLADELSLTEMDAEEALSALVQSELLARCGEKPSRYRYAPARSIFEARVRLLAMLHEQHRFDVVRVLGENAIKRMWSAARLAFLMALSDRRRAARSSRRYRDLGWRISATDPVSVRGGGASSPMRAR